MSRIVFSMRSGVDGIIQLRACEYVDWWKHVFKINHRLGVRPDRCQYYARTTDQNQILALKEHNNSNFATEEERAVRLISKGITDIQRHGLPWTRTLPHMGMDYPQLNDLHRGFTTLSLTHRTDRVELTHHDKCHMMGRQYNFNMVNGREFLLKYSSINDPWEFPLDDKHELREAFVHDVHQINSGVHNIEDRVRVSPRDITIQSSLYPDRASVACPLLDWNTKDPADDRTDTVRADYNLGDISMWCYPEDAHLYNVYDLKNILGKDYLTAYVNYDDPGEWDVCHHFKTTKGGFEIKPHMHRVVHDTLIPWITDDWKYPAWADVVSPIPIGTLDESWILANCTTTIEQFNRGEHLKDNVITGVDLIE